MFKVFAILFFVGLASASLPLNQNIVISSITVKGQSFCNNCQGRIDKSVSGVQVPKDLLHSFSLALGMYTSYGVYYGENCRGMQSANVVIQGRSYPMTENAFIKAVSYSCASSMTASKDNTWVLGKQWAKDNRI